MVEKLDSIPSLTFPFKISLQEVTDGLLSVNKKRLPVVDREKRPAIIIDPKQDQQLLDFFSNILESPELAVRALDIFKFWRLGQPAALVYPNPKIGFEELDAESVELVTQAILYSVNKTTRRRGQSSKLTTLPNSALIFTMAGSLQQVRDEFSLTKLPLQTTKQRLQTFIGQFNEDGLLTPAQTEFIIVTKLAGIFDPDPTDLQMFVSNQKNKPNQPVKIDVCPSFGAGSLGQLMPQPTLVTTAGFGDRGRYQESKKKRFIGFITTALQEADQLERLGIDCRLVTAEWEMPLRQELYQLIANLPADKIRLFGVEQKDLELILNEYKSAYQNTSLLEISKQYFADVGRVFTQEVGDNKLISSLALIEQIGINPQQFIQDFARYLINDWFLPRLANAGNVDEYLTSINTPFTQYFYEIWTQLYGIGTDYPSKKQQALKRSLRLDYLFYRPQYLMENWLASQLGFVGIFGNAREEKKFYLPLEGFKYPKTLPFLPVPDTKLLDTI